MAPTNRKDKKPKSAKPGFDEAALNKSIAKLDKTLATPNGTGQNDQNGKRKRKDTPAEAPKSKKRQTVAAESDSKKGKGKAKRAGKSSSDSLLEEIKALGGNEDDLALIANIDSDAEGGEDELQEFGAEGGLDDALKNELAKFASSLGFQNVHKDDDVETEESEEEASEPEDEIKPLPLPPPTQDESRKGKNAGRLTFDPRPDWHAVSTEHLSAPISDDTKQYSAAIAGLKAYAQTLLEEDAAIYGSKQSSSSTQKFMSTIMSSGTLSDKVSALTLGIQESPVHTIKASENLINLAGKKSRGQAIAALGALVDLLGNGVVLPSDRRLRPFQSQPGLIGSLQQTSTRTWAVGQRLPGNVSKAHLIMWAYENWLKDAYFRIIQLLEVWCGDEVVYSRSRALDFAFGLLKDKPEQEANLLRLLVNKLGDRERKIASRASHLLLQLLNVHPGMKAIVVKTVEEEVLLRPGQSVRSKYFAINTLNQTILSSREPEIADNLVRIYFEMFLSLLKTGALGGIESFELEKKSKDGSRPKSRKQKPEPGVLGNDQETTQKLVSAVLTGVNRAIPFTMTDDSTLEKHLDTLFRITHSSNFNTSIQALMLVQQLAASKQLAVERFYRTLYESLLDPRLITSSKQALYLNLLYRALKNDLDVRRVKAFVKRMLQVINLHQPSFACGILFLIMELDATFPDLKTLLNEPEDYDSDEEEVYKDVVDGDAEKPEPAADEALAAQKRSQRMYDGRKRDPEYSNADKSCLWEIVPFLTHFHPSVGVFAASLLARQTGLPKPDLANHTLMHFLDKFVYRSPKATETQRGGSIMQPVLASGSASIIAVPGKTGARQQAAVNSASFWNLRPEQVAAEDVFFHKYFAQVGKPGQAAKPKKAEEGDEEEDEEAAEEEIWGALVNSRPEVEGEEGNSDVDMDGFDDDDDDDVSLDMGSDDDASGGEMGLDDVPSGDDDAFEGIFGDSDEEAEDEDEDDAAADDTPANRRAKSRQHKKEMKSLPTFASAEDYAEMLAGDDDLDD